MRQVEVMAQASPDAPTPRLSRACIRPKSRAAPTSRLQSLLQAHAEEELVIGGDELVPRLWLTLNRAAGIDLADVHALVGPCVLYKEHPQRRRVRGELNGDIIGDVVAADGLALAKFAAIEFPIPLKRNLGNLRPGMAECEALLDETPDVTDVWLQALFSNGALKCPKCPGTGDRGGDIEAHAPVRLQLHARTGRAARAVLDVDPLDFADVFARLGLAAAGHLIK